MSKAARKGPTAFFLFSEEHRKKVTEELQAAEPEKKLRVGDVAKVIGQKWRELSEEEKKKYIDKAAELAQQAGPVDEEVAEQNAAEKPEQSGHASLPFSLVKKIITCDEDVVRVSGDCVRSMVYCAELFIEFLTEQAAVSATKSKRRTLRLDDFEYVVKRDKRLADMGLKDILQDTEMFAKAVKAGGEGKENEGNEGEGKEERPTAKKAKGHSVQSKNITSFFKNP